MKGWLHTPILDEASFNAQVAALCQLYQDAPKLHDDGVHVISCDEKTGIQALERQITPMKAKQTERQDSSYARHDTPCLIANFEVATGRIIAPTIGDTRTEDDFVNHIARTLDTDPDAKWIFIADNLNTHQSEGLVQLVIKRLGLELSADDIGLKGKSGILQSMETRAKFLSDACHNIQFVYTPKHASWLNQVEIWFGILVNRLLKRVTVRSNISGAQLMDKQYYVYLLANKPYGTLYTGITSNLIQRIYQHKEKLADGFTKKYNVHQLVYYEVHLDVHEAILREKKIKRWHRQWKINLIEQRNPHWTNLAIGLL